MPPKTPKSAPKSASDVIFPPYPTTHRRWMQRKRRVPPTSAERQLVGKLVRDIPHEITPAQIGALSTLLERPPEKIREMVAEARRTFVMNANRYVDIHKQGAERALEAGDYETATRASQWALTNIAVEGQRIVDRAEEGGTAQPKVLIGIKLGGLERDTRNDVTSTPINVMEPDADSRG